MWKHLEAIGFKLETDPRSSRVVTARFDHETVEFDLYERQKQVRRALTDEERAKSWNQDAKWSQTMEPTGQLVFKIKSWMPNRVASSWQDEESKPLEVK